LGKVVFGPRLYEERGPGEVWDDIIAPLQVELFQPKGEHKQIWRTLEVEVTPQDVRAWFRADPAGERQFVGRLTDSRVTAFLGEGIEGQKRRRPDDRSLDGMTASFHPRGALGLLVSTSTASFRNVVVEPLPPVP
jgi:hypothetical protein